MTPILGTPKPSAMRRSSARPHVRSTTAGSDTGPPQKKRKYVPGGPGGGGRYVDEDGVETPVGGTGPGGYNSVTSRSRAGRVSGENAAVRPTTISAGSPTATYSRPRRERPPPRPRYSSAATAAAAVAESDGYKPREERSWEEFHQDFDIDAELMVFSADEVDGASSAEVRPVTPTHGLAPPGSSATENGASSIIDEALLAQQPIPSLKQQSSSVAPQEEETVNVGSNTRSFVTPFKRRAGRPPRREFSMLNGLGSPPAPKIVPVPTHNPKERLNLPKPSHRPVDTFAAYEQDQSVQVNYVDRTMANVGYQESDIFVQPEKTYVRGGEGSIEEELDLAQALQADGDGATNGAIIGRVEYDMDEQDDRWLEALNAHRKEELQVEPIKPAIFEITMTQIEKEWHALEKRIPKPNPKPPQTHRPRSSSAAAVNGEPAGPGEEQDTKCAICDDGDCENTNAIVFCDGCDLAVHQECYGVPFIPEGQWLCRKCQLIGRNTPTCIFCPNTDGAFKQTNTSRWSHLLCALWIPEVNLGNTTFMEPVMDVEKVPKQRWKLICYICHQKMGACIQCGNKNCYQAFHVTCARRAKLFLKMKAAHGGPGSLDASVLKAFCDRHVPADWRRENDVDGALADAKDFYRHAMRGRRWADSQQAALALAPADPIGLLDDDAAQLDELATGGGVSKRKRGQPPKNIWRLPSGAPIVPQLVFQNVESSLKNFSIRKRKEFVAEVCKYWSLKREARRGAALLKRLQLQMETFSSMEMTRRNFAGMGAAGRPRLHKRIEFAERLEKDMEQIRVLCAKVKEREAEKLKDLEVLKSIIDTVYFPIPPLLWPILEKAQALDPKGVFKKGFANIQTKLEERYYTSVSALSADLGSVFSDVIGLASITDAVDAHQRLNGTPIDHSTLTSEQKDLKKLAKRIIKAVQGPLDEAARKEAELGGKPFEKELRDLDAILDNSIRLRQESTVASLEHAIKHSQDEAEARPDAPYTDLQDGVQHQHRTSPSLSIEMKEAESTIHGNATADTPIPNATGQDVGSGNAEAASPAENTRVEHDPIEEITDDAVIRLQVGPGQTVPISNHDTSDIMSGSGGSSAPALSNSGSTNPSTAHPEPLTPPRSETDLLAPLAYGGIPWYLEPFDPVGTTIHDERWTGREVLRGMSEELSEIDDEELNGLVDVDMQDVPSKDAALSVDATAAELQKAKRKTKRRYRGFR